MKTCIHCGKEIKDKSDVCKWCYGDVSPAAMSAFAAQAAAGAPPRPETRTCPYCAEEIQYAAIACKHCGRDLPKVSGVASPPLQPSPKTRITSAASWGCLILVAVVFALAMFVALATPYCSPAPPRLPQ
jgi:double zinc ribbon protein